MPTKYHQCAADLHWHEMSARHVQLCADSDAAKKYSAHIIGTTATR